MAIVEQIEIIQGLDDTWVKFRDKLSANLNLTGETYRNPTMSSWRRLLRLLSDPSKVKVEFIPDDFGMVIRGWRKCH